MPTAGGEAPGCSWFYGPVRRFRGVELAVIWFTDISLTPVQAYCKAVGLHRLAVRPFGGLLADRICCIRTLTMVYAPHPPPCCDSAWLELAAVAWACSSCHGHTGAARAVFQWAQRFQRRSA